MTRKLKRTIILVFLGIYLTAMCGITVFGIFYKQKEMTYVRSNQVQQIVNYMGSINRTWTQDESLGYRCGLYARQLNNMINSVGNEQQISAALYAPGGRKIAESGNLLITPYYSFSDGQGETWYIDGLAYRLEDYLNAEELDQIGAYMEQNRKDSLDGRPYTYRFSIRLSIEDIKKNQSTAGKNLDNYDPTLCQMIKLTVQKIGWAKQGKDSDGKRCMDPLTKNMISEEVIIYKNKKEVLQRVRDGGYVSASDIENTVTFDQISAENVLEWTNASWNGQKKELTDWIKAADAWGRGISDIAMLSEKSERLWQDWENNTFLHDFPEQVDDLETVLNRLAQGETAYFTEAYGLDLKGEKYGQKVQLAPFNMSTGSSKNDSLWSDVCLLIVKSETHELRAAVSMLRYVYLGSAILVFACMWAVLQAVERTARQRVALEEGRRDFTNAVAHELKTPLGITRIFAENLRENTVEEKRTYYLDQIIRQTEEMDTLVLDMIDASKLDSDLLVLQTEVVDINKLVEEALDQLQPVIEEKYLIVTRQIEGQFTVIGDPKYLKKAIRNLVTNAVVHNRDGGEVRVCIGEKILEITNSREMCNSTESMQQNDTVNSSGNTENETINSTEYMENDTASSTENTENDAVNNTESMENDAVNSTENMGNNTVSSTENTKYSTAYRKLYTGDPTGHHTGIGLYLTEKILKKHHLQFELQEDADQMAISVKLD